MKWRMHGANPEKLYEQFGIPMPEKVIDYSDNGNAITRTKPFNINYEALFNDYPDDEVRRLKEIISVKDQVPIENILFANGTNELIYILASYYQNQTVAVFHPTYSEYEKAFKAYDAKVEHVFDFTEIKEHHRAIIICNPNNPTGRFFDYSIMNEVVMKLASHNTDIIIDEAYIDFMPKAKRTLDIVNYRNVYLLRSLTKFFNMSGLRIGYVLSHKDNIEKIKRRQPTWSVNSIAQAVCEVYLNDEDFIRRTKEFYQEERNRFFKEITKLGFKYLPSDVNFFLMEVEDDIDIIKYLLEKGIVVRHTRNFPRLDGKYIRISLKSREENDYLLDALRSYVSKRK
ncbi:MAG: threonine-phosphate decarboxylase [Bacilli bacterium]|nr:threonine-phosphate decarboxylase [Bacilli bacterium]